MAEIERLVKTSELKTSIWASIIKQQNSQYCLNYNEVVDALTLLLVPRGTPTVVHYIDDYVALLYKPDDHEIVGLRVESFRRGFLPKYSELRGAWFLKGSKVELDDLGDLIIAVHKQQPLVAKKISQITGRLVEEKGLKLEPVPA